jgi:hypothetical protein
MTQLKPEQLKKLKNILQEIYSPDITDEKVLEV